MKWNGSAGMSTGKKAVRQGGYKRGTGADDDSLVGVISLEEFQGISVRLD